LTHASDAVASTAQSTTSAAVRVAEAKPLGDRGYRLLGVGVFNPPIYKGQKVAVKGLLVQDSTENRLNVTSLQMLAGACFN
jgi:hypothetical protein